MCTNTAHHISNESVTLSWSCIQPYLLLPPLLWPLTAQYERKMRALEAERRAIEEEKQKVEGTRSEVDRYKQLLLKQRDIMIALTARLNQRDEQIVGLRVSGGGGGTVVTSVE